jgi:hypothetical protein
MNYAVEMASGGMISFMTISAGIQNLLRGRTLTDVDTNTHREQVISKAYFY